MKKINILGIIGLIAFFTCIRWNIIYSITSTREIPVESDDSFSYIIHAKALEASDLKSSMFLNSFKRLETFFEGDSIHEFHRKRLYHRISHFYHLGHAYYLKSLKNIFGIGYIKAHTASIFILNFLMVAGVIGITFFCFNLKAAFFAGVFFTFSFWEVPHQLTAAPREWINFLFFIMLFLWQMNLKLKHFSLALAFIILPFATFHSLGKTLTLIYLGLSVLFLIPKSMRKKAYVSIALSIIALIINYLSYKHLELNPIKELAYQIKFSFKEGVSLLYKNFILLPNSSSKYYRFGLSLLPLFGLVYFARKKSYKMVVIILCGLSPFWGLHFFGLDYNPISEFLSLRKYMLTCSFKSLSVRYWKTEVQIAKSK